MMQPGESADRVSGLGTTVAFEPLPQRLPWPLAMLVILALSGLLWAGIGAAILRLFG
jgi:hypothetical protein